MFNLKAIIVTTILSTLASIIWQTIHFRRQQQFSYKNKFKIILELLNDAVLHCSSLERTLQLAATEISKDYLKKVADIHYPFPGVHTLAERIISDDYHTAYNRLMNQAVDGSRYFFILKHAAFRAKANIAMLEKRYETFLGKDKQRRQDFANRFRQLLLAINLYAQNGQEHKDEKSAALMINLILKFNKERQQMDSMTEAYTLVVDPVLEYLDKISNTPALYQIFEHAYELRTIYRNIEFQTKHFHELLLEQIKEFSKERGKLLTVQKYLNDPLIKQLYHEF